MRVRTPLTLLFMVGPALLAGADEVGDDLKRAKELAEAGKVERALAVADALAAVYADDPRVHYSRSTYLRKLNRTGEAADALERAEATLESWRARGPEEPGGATLAEAIRGEAADLLKFRRLGSDVLRKYRERALKIARDLKSPPEEPFVLSILEDVYRADPAHLEDLLPVWGRTSLESRSTHDERRGRFNTPLPQGAPLDETQLERKEIEAEKLLQGRDFPGARTAALSALEMSPRAARALVILAEALTRLDRVDESAYSALLAIDAPKAGDAAAIRSLYDRAVQQLHSFELRSFAHLKTEVAQELLSLRDQARQAGRPSDEGWLERVTARVAPGDPVTLGGIDRRMLDEELARKLPSLEKASPTLGYLNLLTVPELWRWENRTPGSDLTDDTLTLVPHDKNLMLKAFPRDLKVSASFLIQFKLGYEVQKKQEPWLFFCFAADVRRSGNQENALIIFPENDHVVTFASRRPREIWCFRDRQYLPEGKARGSSGSLIEISWKDATKRLRLTVDGQKVLDRVLNEEDSLNGPWYLGLGGSAVKVQLKDFVLRNQD